MKKVLRFETCEARGLTEVVEVVEVPRALTQRMATTSSGRCPGSVTAA